MKGVKMKKYFATALLIFLSLLACFSEAGLMAAGCFFLSSCSNPKPLPDSYVDRHGNYWVQCEDVDFPRDWHITVKGKRYCFKEKAHDEK